MGKVMQMATMLFVKHTLLTSLSGTNKKDAPRKRVDILTIDF